MIDSRARWCFEILNGWVFRRVFDSHPREQIYATLKTCTLVNSPSKTACTYEESRKQSQTSRSVEKSLAAQKKSIWSFADLKKNSQFHHLASTHMTDFDPNLGVGGQSFIETSNIGSLIRVRSEYRVGIGDPN